jgi:predicted TIM-barrel fold metal-dependent hydrolase
MADYRPYMPSRHHEEFDAFCEVHAREGRRITSPEHLAYRIDPEIIEQWVLNVVEPGRLEGQSDPLMRLAEMDRQGVSAEVIFPDFGVPFELIIRTLGVTRTPEQVEVGNRAHNRWLADFCKTAPERLVGLALVEFDDVDKAVDEIRWAKEAGLRGIVLPSIDEDTPFFHERHEPIWNVLEELEMPVNTHAAISSITNRVPAGLLRSVPHPACAGPLVSAQVFFHCQQILSHFIWGGVLDRHPNLQLVLTEQGSGWVIGALRGMDYSYENSYLRRDVREVVRLKPSEYFERQCLLGSSLFSLAEAKARHEIGVHKIGFGTDYPHHEGTWGAGPGTADYIRATLGAAEVPVDEARLILGENTLRLWRLDAVALTGIAARIGPAIAEILTPPIENSFPRGDVHKPLATAF